MKYGTAKVYNENPVKVYSVSTKEAKFAVTGSHPMHGSGVLAWTSCELHAYIINKYINKTGGSSKVEIIKGTVDEWLETNKDDVLELVLEGK